MMARKPRLIYAMEYRIKWLSEWLEMRNTMIMLNTSNNVERKKDISMKYCGVEFKNTDGRIVMYCRSGFYGNDVPAIVSYLYNYFSDWDIDNERMVITI